MPYILPLRLEISLVAPMQKAALPLTEPFMYHPQISLIFTTVSPLQRICPYIIVTQKSAAWTKTHYTHAEERKRYDEGIETTDSRTVSLIDDFLEAQIPAAPVTHPIDAAQDYIGYLLQRESILGEQEEESLPMNGGGVVEDFLESETGRIVLTDNEDNESEQEKRSANEKPELESEGNNEILTEIMAGIYIKQGKYENAVKIIRQLSLKYPKKNRYFADQIRFLEKLIINNKHK